MLDREREIELTKYYDELDDERLVRLARNPEELTELARELISAEIRKRRLELAPKPSGEGSTQDAAEVLAESLFARGQRQLWYARPGDYAELAPPDCVVPIDEHTDIHAARVTLEMAGIPRDEFWPERTTDLRQPFWAVLPEDRVRAKELLARPISEEVKQQVRAELEDPEDWQVPRCPACGTADPLLTSIDPCNTWLCEDCGHRWQAES